MLVRHLLACCLQLDHQLALRDEKKVVQLSVNFHFAEVPLEPDNQYYLIKKSIKNPDFSQRFLTISSMWHLSNYV